MVSLPTLVVSDAHLGAVPEENARAFAEFLRQVPEMTDRLLINGDLFDFWFEYRSVILRQHFQVLRCLAELGECGVAITLVGGNHDAWGGSFLRDELGIRLVDGPAVLELSGRRAFVAHGDGVAGGDRGYRLLRWLTRSRFGSGGFRFLHPDLGDHVVRWVSSTERRREGEAAAASPRADRLSEHAVHLLLEDPELDLVIFGHSHRPEVREVAPGRYYVNAGDWVHHCSYAVIGPGPPELRFWTREAGPRSPPVAVAP